MPLSVIRFDMRAPGLEPAQAQPLYRAALEMGEWADRRGFDMLVLSEHHGSADGYLPSPLVMAGAMAACTRRIALWISALVVPLHDPVRLAEDIAVVDQLSGGRLSIITGLGYRPVEHALFGRDWHRRGRRLDECLQTMLDVWAGKPVDVDGEPVAITPRPVQQPHPNVLIGGSGPAAARRAARFGLGFFPAIADDELAELYRAECERLGHKPGLVAQPKGPGTLFVSEDPDRMWSQVGPYLLHDAITYNDWQSADIRSHVRSRATTVEELRAEGVYQIHTPEECVAMAADLGPTGGFTHHPLCGGAPPEIGWESLELFADRVLPHLAARG
jgi:alkanesulfonate monooxygenase SsuD/methylene tetrahydromethanopterin reductase-like flavin-dependent oxidoreductase (luciferase family)